MTAADIRDAFFDEFYEIAARDPNILFLSSDMDAFSLRKFKNDFPERFINVGVAEQNMVNIAAGLALSGKKVFCYGIGAFVTMRCFEQIKVNLCSLNLPVTIIGAGAGFSFGYDGPTHHGLIDMAVMRLLPEMTIYNLSCNDAAKASVKWALTNKSPVYLRLDKGKFPSWGMSESVYQKGFRILSPLADVNLVSTGFMTERVLKISEQLKTSGIKVGVVDVLRIKPFSDLFEQEVVKTSRKIFTIEENTAVGGLGSVISEVIASKGYPCPHEIISAPDRQFVEYGDRDWFHDKYKLDEISIVNRIKKAA